MFLEEVDVSFGTYDGEAVARCGLEDSRWWRRKAWVAVPRSWILDLW
jgi:hypothetical protein